MVGFGVGLLQSVDPRVGVAVEAGGLQCFELAGAAGVAEAGQVEAAFGAQVRDQHCDPGGEQPARFDATSKFRPSQVPAHLVQPIVKELRVRIGSKNFGFRGGECQAGRECVVERCLAGLLRGPIRRLLRLDRVVGRGDLAEVRGGDRKSVV